MWSPAASWNRSIGRPLSTIIDIDVDDDDDGSSIIFWALIYVPDTCQANGWADIPFNPHPGSVGWLLPLAHFTDGKVG